MSAWPVSFSAGTAPLSKPAAFPCRITISHIFMGGGERNPLMAGFVCTMASELRFLGGPRHAPNSEYCEDSEWPYGEKGGICGAGENLSGFWLQFVGWRVGFLGLPDKSLVN